MAFTDSQFRGAMLVMLDGADPKTAPRVLCDRCGRPLMRVFVTAGVRRAAPELPPHQDVCITTRGGSLMGLGPCLRAFESKGLIDRLMEASRA